MTAMLRSTPARIGVGRAGTRYRTNTLLRFRADHAAAKDAVVSEVDAKLVARLGLVELTTRAPDKRIFLERPDAGRALCDEGKQRARREVRASAAGAGLLRRRPVGGGASTRTSRRFTARSRRRWQARGLRVGTPVFVRRSRVKVMDEIARLVDAEACVFTCGERPGLGFADSLSSLLHLSPRQRRHRRRSRGHLATSTRAASSRRKAAQAVAEACARILAAKKSGVVL